MHADQNASGTSGALDGLRVIDLSRVLGGPFCTQILGDHGADVIKIEPPSGDETRDWGPPFRDGISAYFTGINRNKKTIALDLTQQAGRDVLFRMLETADVVVENFKPGTLERWGMAYETTLKDRFPRLIHCRITGFGADGSFGGFPGYDAMVQGWAGLMSVTGSQESGPLRIGLPVVDLSTGLNAVIGILLACLERSRSGLGQSIDLTLYDVAVSLQHPHSAAWFMNGMIPRLTGNSHPTISPYGLYKTRTTDIVIGSGNDRQFRKLLQLLGRPEFADDERFRTNKDRAKNKDSLNQILEELLRHCDGESLAVQLMESGVPAGALLSIPEVLGHSHTTHRDMVVAAPDSESYRGTGLPIKMSRTPGAVRSAPRQFGADNEEVISQLGYDRIAIDEMRANRVIVDARAKN